MERLYRVASCIYVDMFFSVLKYSELDGDDEALYLEAGIECVCAIAGWARIAWSSLYNLQSTVVEMCPHLNNQDISESSDKILMYVDSLSVIPVLERLAASVKKVKLSLRVIVNVADLRRES